MKINRTALITGSAKGLGVQIAHELAASGIRIAINYRSSAAEAEALKQQLENTYGCEVLLIPGDVSRPHEAANMVETAVTRWGRLDMLILNAGPYIKERKKLMDYTDDEWNAMINGNLSSAFYICRAAIPVMRKNSWGRIITIGFERAMNAPGWLYRSAFAAAKVGLVSLTRSLSLEEAEYGITVNMICPGDIIGEAKQKTIAELASVHDPDTPVGRPGSGQDVARAVSFLCMEQSDFITGAVLEITGGKDILAKHMQGK
ncbi:SDR family oxidoreductase [Aneurinibacillus sp. Ricciae_BoGa-3]|uniref:SDR family oxidoreductase n=1 Tax=Aneurinibacillus sp. Ricciae_BoGa-3 TaxID=3022697 RepID=UPI00233FF6E4|nr:SDR family oxidoreductase [Aneurinibacillus sp. Ricciae_BoGa-3]WCK53783.1 SDR family oxidoreductase [Aneurinibacillus sp. Ricciae_BoGa-3]